MRKVVRVVDDQRLASQRDVTGQTGARNRQDLLFERHDVDRVVLRQFPAQHLLPADGIEEIERSGVGARDLARLAEDHRQQNGVVALGGERDADLADLAQLARPLAKLALELVCA